MNNNICVFAASSTKVDKKYTDAAFEIGKLLAENGYNMVFGGGRIGLMGASARGIKEGGGKVIGVIPVKLNVPGIAFEDCDELIVTPSMHERKAKMEELSEGFVVLPGGFGTLEELMEVLTLNQLGYIKTPVIIFNQDGFYDGLIQQLNAFVDTSFTAEDCLGIFSVAKTPYEVVKNLKEYKPVVFKR